MAVREEKTLAPHLRGVDPDYSPDKNGFVGVSPEYANAANKTDEPHQAKGDTPEELAEAGVNNQHELADAEESDKNDEDGEKKSSSKTEKSGSTKSTSVPQV